MSEPESRDLDVAIIGMAGRFPGAGSVSEFWDVLCDGLNTTRQLSAEQLAEAGVPPVELADPRYVPVWAGLDDVDQFDASFFSYSPAEAELVDPQQRIFLECAWAAVEDAGYDPAQFPGDIAVYAATGMNLYLLRQIMPDADYVRSVGQFALAVASDKDNLSTRVSYKLSLTGPSVTMQSNCSSGMVSLHHAVGLLLDGQADMAIVGAVSVKSREPRGYLAEESGISSPSGQIRSFDARADGYFLGDAVAALTLRRLDDAIQDGDQIYAVIRGTAVSNDGSARVSFAAPGRAGQVKAMRTALALARVDPATVDYVEANGSGTLMGDAIEVAAVREAYGCGADSSAELLIGSVKPNFGNLDTVSGLASLMKVALALRNGQLPPTIQYAEPNPNAGLGSGPLQVNDRLRSWRDRDGRPRRAGVSSFGVGGTNVHAVLEAAPQTQRPATETGNRWQLILVSARTGPALAQARQRLAGHLERRTDQSLADVAYTTQVGRRTFEHRAFVLASRRGEAAQALLAMAEPGPDGGGGTGDAAAIIKALRGMDQGSEEYRDGLRSLGNRWQAGAAIPWTLLQEGRQRRRVSLPAYPFQRERFWHEPADSPRPSAAGQPEAGTAAAAGRPATVSAAFAAPNGLIEDCIAAVWCRRLGIDSIGVDDSFLELGGDSLIAARIANEIAESLHVEPNLRAFLESPTIAVMARLVDEQLAYGEKLRSLAEESAADDGEDA